MSMIQSDLLLGQEGGAGYTISRSLRFSSADSSFLSRTPASAGNRKTWTWAGWVKRSALVSGGTYNNSILFSAGGSNPGFVIGFDKDSRDNAIQVNVFRGTNAGCLTNAIFRDLSAWMHICLAFDTTQATAANRIKLWVNGVEQTWASTNYPAQNTDYEVNNTSAHNIGRASQAASEFFSGYLADIHFIDGQALTPSSFGEFDANGIWQPKAYSGTYGTNGFQLKFADNSTAAALGTDTSGAGNNWTVNNISATTGGPTSVAAASGALPIYNTTDTYGTTKGSGVRSDSNASSLVLAIPAGSSTGLDLTDQIPSGRTSSAKTITSTGVTNSTAVFKYYGGSVLFGTSGTKQVDITSTADFDFGSGNFTIELWVYGTSWGSGTGTGGLFSKRSNSDAVGPWISSRINPNGTVFVLVANAAGTDWQLNTSSTATVSTQSWNHIAYCRNGSTFTVYLNGIAVISSSLGQAIAFDSYKLMLGNLGETGSNRCQLDGYIQDFRIYKGIAKYTSNFNPPSSTQNATIAAGNDSTVDSPTNYGTDTGAGGEVRGNYATLNPLDTAGGSGFSTSNGNLDGLFTNTGSTAIIAGTMYPSSGKWYAEFTLTAIGNNAPATRVGVQKNVTPRTYLGGDSTNYAYLSNGQKQSAASSAAYGSTYTTGDVIGVALNLDAGTITFYKNGVSQGQAYSGLSGEYTFAYTDFGNGAFNANFGQRPFAYTAPSGFKALCTTNLPSTTITTSGSYTGNGVADGPFVYLNGVPTAMTVGGNAVTFGTHADKLSNGFKIRTTSTTYNQNASTYNYTITTTGDPFKRARAQSN